MEKPVFLKNIKRVHFTGIKGVGMIALACCLQDIGIKISGSDVEEKFVTDEVLKKRKISWKIGFKEENLKPKPDLLITTGAHGGLNNPEVIIAKKLKISVLTHAEALGKLMESKLGISVCGVGGKTTTSSIIANILSFGKRKPSYAIGVAGIKPLGFPGKWDEGKEFVVEADEYANSPGVDNRPRFIFQNPKIIVVTNIEYDHPDIYPNFEKTKEAFASFFEKIPKDGLLLACADNPNTLVVAKKFKPVLQTYGFSPQADWRIENFTLRNGETFFDLSFKGILFRGIKIKIPGRFNILNSAAGFAVGIFLGMRENEIKVGLKNFRGTKRRFEFIGERRGVMVYDDYAHHPSEIKQVIDTAKKWFPQKRIITVFQPHTYSRTKALLKEFGRCFNGAGLVIISEIYASAREKDNLGITGKILAQEVAKNHPAVFFRPGLPEVIELLKKEVKKDDIIFTLGAGSIFSWGKNILKSLNS
ncbi:MAG: UDP-N-acetylmuramate--L-alanine ligase [Microgenomates group bacterium]